VASIPEPSGRVVLYTAHGCHLCELAREVLDAERVDYREVDITGDPRLEAEYREWLPVVEIDGRRAFVYRIPVEALRRKLVPQS
jgi:glutaredoxin